MASIAMFQMKNEGCISDNLRESLVAIKTAANNGADLILFPEVQLTEFFPQYPEQDVSGYAVDIGRDYSVERPLTREEAVPINFLLPIKGTRLAEKKPLRFSRKHGRIKCKTAHI